MLNLQTWIVLGIGILFGALIASASFRKRFFVGFRHFMSGVGTGQKREKATDVNAHPTTHQYHRRRFTECPDCEGLGRVKKPMPKILDEHLFGERWIECVRCGGSGEIEI